MRAKRPKRKTHCIRGHEFTPENTYIEGRDRRRCRTCRATRGERQAPRRVSTHCKYGHEWTVETTLWVNRGRQRRCAPCLVAYEVARAEALRLQRELDRELDRSARRV